MGGTPVEATEEERGERSGERQGRLLTGTYDSVGDVCAGLAEGGVWTGREPGERVEVVDVGG